MEGEISIEGFGISSNVVETILTLAAAEVSGVAGVGTPNSLSGLYTALTNGTARAGSTGIEATAGENGGIVVSVRMQVYYGYRLTDVADAVRAAIADAAASQIGAKVEAVDVFIDGVVFNDGE